MKKFVIGILTGLILAVLTGVVFIFSAMRLGERRPDVPDGATLVLRLGNDVPEKEPVEVPLPFIGSADTLTVLDIWEGLRSAATDPRVKAVILETGRVGAGWGKLHELREGLDAFRKSGKPLVATMRSPNSRDYYVASAADRVYMSPEDLFDVKGVRAEVMYLKNALGKLGVAVEIEHRGKYKDAGDMFSETSMSPESREVINSILDGVYSEMIRAFAEGRKRPAEEIRALVDAGPYTARQAAAKGLVDALRYEDQVHGELKSRLKQDELKRYSFHSYVRATSGTAGRGAKKKIAFVVGEGAIARGEGTDAMGSDEGFTSGAFIKMLRRVGSDSSIGGVILRVDSPGGDAVASDEMLREVRLLSKKKPMVISFSDAAASGGYYISMTGDPIVSYPNTVTGSIGVIYGKVNLRGLYDKIGVNKEILTRGTNAAIDSDYEPMTPEARAKLREGIEEIYREFVSRVAEGRNKKWEEVAPLAEGRAWLGSQAKQNGLVDELGGIDKAVAMVKKRVGLKPEDKVDLVPYPPARSIFDQYLKSTSEQQVEARVAKLLGFDYRVWMQGGMLRMAPYRVDIR
ncbi:MAG TPA: signal peptide peptidase SppA [Bryobacteraceae bacterium]|nr:signal peptide peptidase SppA [Bryobacteraceae bacterium]